MIDDYQEAMKLVDAMKNCLPILVYPAKSFIQYLKQENIKIKSDQRLEITDVLYMEDLGGITCSLKLPFKTEKAYLISITHLVPMANHPLRNDIRTYQINRVKNLAKQ
jgi:hypothetical protein